MDSSERWLVADKNTYRNEVSIVLSRIAFPSACLRSSVIERLLRLFNKNAELKLAERSVHDDPFGCAV